MLQRLTIHRFPTMRDMTSILPREQVRKPHQELRSYSSMTGAGSHEQPQLVLALVSPCLSKASATALDVIDILEMLRHSTRSFSEWLCLQD